MEFSARLSCSDKFRRVSLQTKEAVAKLGSKSLETNAAATAKTAVNDCESDDEHSPWTSAKDSHIREGEILVPLRAKDSLVV
jgi:hypothetical protein